MKVLIFLLAGCLHSQAAQVSWSSEAQSVDRDSTGKPLDAAFIFELGAFVPGFIPTSANTQQWAANWTAAARVAYDAVNKAVSGPRFTYSTNATPFLPNNRGWIWGYHPQHPGEWILIGRPNWLWPNASDPFGLPVTWGVVAATQAIVGKLNTAGVQLQTAPIGTYANVPALTFAAWQTLSFNAAERANPAISGPDADPDGDGIPNGVEFLTGTTPRASSSPAMRILPRIGVEISRINGRTGTLSGEVSSDLQTWFKDSAVQMSPTPGLQTFTATDPALFLNRAFWRFRSVGVQ